VLCKELFVLVNDVERDHARTPPRALMSLFEVRSDRWHDPIASRPVVIHGLSKRVDTPCNRKRPV